MPPKKEEGVRLDSLSPEQLVNLREALKRDVESLNSNLQTMQSIAATFAGANRTLLDLSQADEGQQILLPLTSSLYVPGQLASKEAVLVDIGTNYYVEMAPSQAQEYCSRKIEKLSETINVAGQNIRERQSNLMEVDQVLQEKVAALQRQPAGK